MIEALLVGVGVVFILPFVMIGVPFLVLWAAHRRNERQK